MNVRDPRVAEALVRLQNNEDFQLVVDNINAYRHELIEFTMFSPASDQTQTYAGMARAVTEILRGFGSAAAFLEKTRSSRGH